MTLVCTVSLALALIPAMTMVLNWRLFTTPSPTRRPPRVSVLIPARNEAANIGPACASVLANRDVELELLVMDDHSSDETGEIVRAIPDPRVRLVSAPPLPSGWTGKQHACASLARSASHELLVFLDADVRLAPDALTSISGFMQRTGVSLGSGFPAEITVTWAECLLIPLIPYLLLGFLPLWIARRLRSPAFGAGCGQLIATWRDAYQQVGGHSLVPATLHDGIALPRAFPEGREADRRVRCQPDLDLSHVLGPACRVHRLGPQRDRGHGNANWPSYLDRHSGRWPGPAARPGSHSADPDELRSLGRCHPSANFAGKTLPAPVVERSPASYWDRSVAGDTMVGVSALSPRPPRSLARARIRILVYAVGYPRSGVVGSGAFRYIRRLGERP